MKEKQIGLDHHISSSHMILQRDLNPHDTLFAGKAASYMIECAFLEAMDFLQTKHLVCQGLDGLRFVHPVRKADAIHIKTSVVHLGSTSVGVYVAMYIVPENIKATDCFVTFVQIVEATGKAACHNMALAALDPDDHKQKLRYKTLRSVK